MSRLRSLSLTQPPDIVVSQPAGAGSALRRPASPSGQQQRSLWASWSPSARGLPPPRPPEPQRPGSAPSLELFVPCVAEMPSPAAKTPTSAAAAFKSPQTARRRANSSAEDERPVSAAAAILMVHQSKERLITSGGGSSRHKKSGGKRKDAERITTVTELN
eukprot:m51a1_g11621 hypothetical protein (161) ;mRNA; r:31198-31767